MIDLCNEKKSGIYCLLNKIEDKRFIGATTNIHNLSKRLLKRLKNESHSNRRLQDAWNRFKNSDNVFEIIILEEFDYETSPVYLEERKVHWINYYKSNFLEYGYNQELTKKPWEIERSKESQWDIEGDISEVLGNIISKLDYELEFAEDRLNHLKNILDERTYDWLIGYVSSQSFINKQVKNKDDFLAENDISEIGFSIIVDYLVFPQYKNELDKKLKEEQKHQIRKKRSKPNMNYTRGNEILFGDEEDIKNYSVKTKHEITEKDLNEFPEIKEVYLYLLKLKKELGYGKAKETREEIHNEIKRLKGSNYLRVMKKTYTDLSTEILKMKEILSGTIRFKRITDGTTVYVFDEDTGYFDDKEQNGYDGDYILVSENKIDFSKENHILGLLDHYSDLKHSVYDKPDSEMWAILYDLEELIENSDFTEHEKKILVDRIDKFTFKEISEGLQREYGLVYSPERVRYIYNTVIPKQIAETYIQQKEDWLYTYKIKGTYKTCSKCKEVKLANERHFSPNTQNSDGYHSYCRSCR